MPHAIIRGNNVADTKSISAMHQSGSKSTPATRPSRFLLRQILKPMRRNADASQLSTSHGTCSVRRLAARRSSTSNLKNRVDR